MINLKPYSSSVLAFAGFILIVIGIYFVFIRPALLPEDFKYIGTKSSILNERFPQLSPWLQKVFWVMGSYICTSGLLTVFIALTSFRKRTYGAFTIVAISGITSIGSMTVINFIIDSDFKWTLLALTLPWVFALTLYKIHK